MSTVPGESIWLTATFVQMLHAESIKLFGGEYGLRDQGLLQSSLAKSQHLHGYGGSPSLFALAAAYGYGLVRNHAFVDGNKRTALLAIRAFLFMNGYTFIPDQVETVTVMEGVSEGIISQDSLAIWIKDNTSPQQK